MTSSSNVPEYLNKNLFKNVLKTGFSVNSDKVNIRNLNVSLLSGGGGHYTSNIYNVDLEYRNEATTPATTWKQMSFIIKDMKAFGSGDEKKIFEKEMSMFQKTMPRIEKLFPEDIQFSPRCYYFTLEPNKTAIFQNLNKLSYKLADREKGLDEHHSRIILRKIAKLHAGSMVLVKQNPEVKELYHEGIFSESGRNAPMHKVVFIDPLSHLIKIIEDWPDYEVIAGKLKVLEQNLYDKYFEMERRTKIKVINHGDLWVNNFMFKYENEKPVDVLFFDFQISYYASLGIDINYFLNTSVQLDVLKTKRYELLKEYYHSLRKGLEILKCKDIPSWDDIKNEIRATELYGFIAFEAIFPLVSLDRESSKDNSLETFADEDKSKQNIRKMYSSQRMKETMEFALNRFDELGLFETL